MKALIWLALIAIAVLWWNMARRRSLRKPPQPGSADQAGKLIGDAIVPCAHCGVHLPKADAVEAGQRLYCSPAHAEAGPRDLRA